VPVVTAASLGASARTLLLVDIPSLLREALARDRERGAVLRLARGVPATTMTHAI
jgi:hypothetical protein